LCSHRAQAAPAANTVQVRSQNRKEKNIGLGVLGRQAGKLCVHQQAQPWGYVLHFAACHICTGRLRAQSGDTQQSRRLFQRGVWLVVTDASRLFTSTPPAIRPQWCWHLGRQQDRSDACPIQLCKAEALTCIAPQQGSRTLAAPVCLRPGVPSVHAAAAYMQAMLAGLGCCSLPCLING